MDRDIGLVLQNWFDKNGNIADKKLISIDDLSKQLQIPTSQIRWAIRDGVTGTYIDHQKNTRKCPVVFCDREEVYCSLDIEETMRICITKNCLSQKKISFGGSDKELSKTGEAAAAASRLIGSSEDVITSTLNTLTVKRTGIDQLVYDSEGLTVIEYKGMTQVATDLRETIYQTLENYRIFKEHGTNFDRISFVSSWPYFSPGCMKSKSGKSRIWPPYSKVVSSIKELVSIIESKSLPAFKEFTLHTTDRKAHEKRIQSILEFFEKQEDLFNLIGRRRISFCVIRGTDGFHNILDNKYWFA